MQSISVICAISFVLLTVTFREGLALKCWRCSSDSRGGEFCRDPFKPELLAGNALNWAYIDCKEASEPNKVAVCQKIVHNIRDKVVVKRSCAIQSIYGKGDECHPKGPSYVKTVFCDNCRTDGCNGNISTDYAALADEFPPEELTEFVTIDNGHVDEDEGPIDDDVEDDDNNIGRDATQRGNLITKPMPTEAVHHSVDPEMTPNGNSADQRRLFISSLSLVSLAMIAYLFSH